MRKHWLKRTLVAFSIVCMIATCTVPVSVYAKQTNVEEAKDEIQHGNVSFKDFKYHHYDTKKFYQKIDTIKKLMKNRKNSKQVLKLFSELNDAQHGVMGENEVLLVFNTLDVNNKYYQKEANYSNDICIKMENAINTVAKKILSSPCKNDAKKEWGKEQSSDYQDCETLSKKHVKLLSEEQKLIQKYYQNSVNTYKTKIAGNEYTAEELNDSKNLTEEQKQKGTEDLINQENACLGSIYVDLVKVRQQIAKESGYANYSEYCYDEYDRDYTTKDSANLSKQVKKYIVPEFSRLTSSMNEKAQEKLDKRIGELDGDQIYDLMGPYLPRISKTLKKNYNYMRKYHLYDVNFSSTKSAQGYTQYITKYKEVFTFLDPAFNYKDLMDQIHEFGHYNEAMLDTDLFDNLNLDLAEIASQGLELLYTHFNTDMLGNEDGTTANYYTLYNKMDSIVEGALNDEFQQKVYQQKNPTLEQINKIYTDLRIEYGLCPNEEGITDNAWIYVSHNFDEPLYYISYAISVAPAFEIWEKSVTDFKSACDSYTNVVNHGASGDYLKTLKECKLTSPFEDGYMKTLAETIDVYIKNNLGK